MPMVWDAAADAKLMAGLMSICDIKTTGKTARDLAKFMGADVTPKAITHRLQKVRAAAKVEDGGEPAVKKVKTAAGVKKGGQRARKAATEYEGDAEEGLVTPPPSTKGRKRSANGEVKGQQADGIEVGEDIGEGLRAVKEEGDEDAEGEEDEELI